jgi:hypothetical protein
VTTTKELGVLKPPGTQEALRASIAEVGVINAIVVAAGTDVIVDGRARKAIADELGVACPRVYRRNTTQAAERMLASRRNERDLTTRGEVVRLGLKTDAEGVGLFTEEAIAEAMGVSLDYAVGLLKGMATRVMLPELRRIPGGTVKSLVTSPPPGPEQHAIAKLMPEVSGLDYDALKEDIATNGQKVPILLDSEGLLIDGKARWRICQELGMVPTTQILTENPWAVGLARNRERFPNMYDRARILAQVPVRASRTLPDDDRPPPVPELAELFDLPAAWFRSFRQVAEKYPELGEAVLDETIRVGTAVRIVREIPPKSWGPTLQRMRAERARGLDPKLPMRVEDLPADEHLTRPRRRRDVVTVSTIDQVRSDLAALGSVLTGADGQLDPSITSEQAAQLLTGLSTDRRHLTRLSTLLKQRKEST